MSSPTAQRAAVASSLIPDVRASERLPITHCMNEDHRRHLPESVEPLIGIPELAAWLGVSRHTVKKWATRGPESGLVPRMIIVNGVVGLSVLLGALAHGEQSFRIEGSGPALAALVTLATLSLVLPTLTTSSSGPTYSEAQLLFAALVWIESTDESP